MKSYGKRARARIEEQRAADIEYVEMLELCYILANRRLHGLGDKRLEDLMVETAKVHIDYEHRYYNADDRRTIGARADVLAMKRDLADAGIDYDAMCTRAGERAKAYEIEKYGGIGK